MKIAKVETIHVALPTRRLPVSTPAQHQRGQMAGIYYRDDLVARPFRFEDGCLVVPDGPGLGVTVDEAKLAKYRIA